MLEEVIQSPTQTVFQIAVQSLQELNLQITQIDNQNGVIGASKLTLPFTFGESISIEIKPYHHYNSIIRILSKSTKSFQFFDWGANAKNEIMILNQIKSHYQS